MLKTRNIEVNLEEKKIEIYPSCFPQILTDKNNKQLTGF